VLVGFPPGGPTDLVARLYAQRLSGGFAPAVVVENRPGAGGRLAAEQTRAAEADGTTLLVSPASTMVLAPHLFPRTTRYDALVDFLPVATLCTYGFGFAVPAAHPARSLAEFGAWARAQGTEVLFGAPTPGSSPHFLGLRVAAAQGWRGTLVPYRGAAPALQDLLAGRIPLLGAVLSDFVAQRGEGLRVLAVSSARRVPQFAESPTLAELGHGDLTLEEWFGLFLPARAPAPLARALHAQVEEAARGSEIRAALDRLAFQPEVLAPEAFAARLARERESWAAIVRDSGFVPDEA